MPNLVNTLVVDEYEREFADANGMLFVSFGGLSVEESSALRNELAAQGVKFRMVRNSLARRVLAGHGREMPAEALEGNTAIAYGEAEHAIVAAKLFSTKEVKKAGKVTLKAGVLDGRVLGPQDAAALADIPDRATLQAQLLGCISGPARGLVSVLDGLPAGVARVLQAHVDAQGGEPSE
jgi:large subunit ribosomal protein L10